ncbi:MAG: YhcH/YjgK/YiaL family protein [Lentisphaeria bacterium]|nr:YhcH/YjgK/YiaL family protein [Lentisphaeria bacterium]
MILAPVGSREWDFLPETLKKSVASPDLVPEGKTVLIPEKMWMNRFSVTPATEGEWEAHHDYYDLQLVVEREEFCLIASEADCTARGEYHANDDYRLFDGPAATACRLALRPGTMLLIAPGEVHLPGVSIGGDALPHTKIVVKIHRSLLERN